MSIILCANIFYCNFKGVGHERAEGGGPLNAFGEAFRSAGSVRFACMLQLKPGETKAWIEMHDT